MRPICQHRGVVGWDIGGANIKVARIAATGDWPAAQGAVLDDAPMRAHVRAYELQRDPGALPGVLRSLADEIGAAAGDAHAVTMTAELSQYFRVKRDGVAFVLDAVGEAFPHSDVHVYTVQGNFLSPDAARDASLDVAAANWAATARAVARLMPDVILVDIGTTTTDIIPIADGRVCAAGWNDPARLASGELLYLGAIRTPVEAITHTVPLGDGHAGTSAEGFAVAGDVHLWRGTLPDASYAAPTPDGRPATREFAGERLARVVCADRELVDAAALDRIADAIAMTQIERTAAAIGRVRARHPEIGIAVVTGAGDFIAAAAAERAGLEVRWLADALGSSAAVAAPATAVAVLLAASLRERRG